MGGLGKHHKLRALPGRGSQHHDQPLDHGLTGVGPPQPGPIWAAAALRRRVIPRPRAASARGAARWRRLRDRRIVGELGRVVADATHARHEHHAHRAGRTHICSVVARTRRHTPRRQAVGLRDLLHTCDHRVVEVNQQQTGPASAIRCSLLPRRRCPRRRRAGGARRRREPHDRRCYGDRRSRSQSARRRRSRGLGAARCGRPHDCAHLPRLASKTARHHDLGGDVTGIMAQRHGRGARHDSTGRKR